MRNHADFIVIEGGDGSGKKTQTDLLSQYLRNMTKIPVESISYPVYEDPSAYCVTRILREDGVIDHFNNLRYIKSAAYAMNRALTFFDKYNPRLYNIIKTNGIVVFDRYTTSNILHVASILDSIEEVDDCINFIQDLEYDKFKLPKPTKVFYLDVPPEISMKNIEKRGNEKDLNENIEHLSKVYERSKYVVNKLGWTRIDCMNSAGKQKSPLEIHFEITKDISSIL